MNVEYAGPMTLIIHITAEFVVCSVVILTGILARPGRSNILAFGQCILICVFGKNNSFLVRIWI